VGTGFESDVPKSQLLPAIKVYIGLMNILYFLCRRLHLVSQLYDESTKPFREAVQKIEAGEPPYVDNRNPEDDDVSEPAFLEEALRALESI